nr:hypothetical protein [Cytophagales bacterium]
MNKVQLLFHHVFTFVWNAIFVLSYPFLATFGLVFVGITMFFSWISRMLKKISPSTGTAEFREQGGWETISLDAELIEGRLHKQILFGPNCYQFRRKDGIPSILDEHIFGKKIKVIKEGLIMERWNSTDIKEIPDFDICLYNPDEDLLTKLTTIKCFDWHLSEKEDNFVYFKWFDGIQGGEVKVSLA